MLEIRYVWEWPVRLTHWLNVLCIAVLSFTGFYIGHPFITAPETAGWVMGWNRFLHFVFAYLFTVSLVARLLWFFLGNRHASWRAFVPWLTAQGRKNMLGTFRYYTFLKKKVPYVVGHNALAAVAYSVVFALFIIQIVSGFALYAQFQPGGFWNALLGPVLLAFGNQGLRLTHHLIMWLLHRLCHPSRL